ncbi:MAG: phosphatidate cytidylyltransferase [Planctomycetes bacterium]|nr:phosphatidate cytidylyltransferase [Planctomycetota bacterium]
MKIRLILGSLLIAVLVSSYLIDRSFEFSYASFAIVVLMGLGAAIEWNRIMGTGHPTYPRILVTAAVAYPLVECTRINLGWDAGLTDVFFLTAVIILVCGRAVLAGHVEDGLDRISRTLFGFILLYLFYRLVPVLLNPPVGHGPTLAYILVFTSKSCDIGAYLIGRTFGKRKLIPKVSPGKTVAGAVGGLSFSLAVGGICFGQLGVHWLFGTLFGLVIGAVTMLSDLVESLIKRCAGVKDSAALLPEMGGILDLIDSLILAAPIGYFLFILFL